LTAGEKEQEQKPKAPLDRVNSKEQKRLEAEQRNARSKARREQQQLVARLEKEIHDLETRQIELTAELEKPETYDTPGAAMKVNRELSGVSDSLEAATAQWEAEATKLHEFDND
jgi:ATP-binding cassette subfamily F protein 3